MASGTGRAAERVIRWADRIFVYQLTPERPDSPFADRHYYSLEVPTPSDLAITIPEIARTFVLFLAWDATNETDEQIRSIAREILRKGIAYLVAWGPDCSRVHDLFDFTAIEEGYYPSEYAVIMTTWHDDESLASALWFFLFNTVPDEAFQATCKTGIAAAVANPVWARHIQHYLRHPEELNRDAEV